MMPWESMDVESLTKRLSERFSLSRITYGQVANGLVTPERSIIIHSSSQQPEYKNYIDDVLLYLHARSNILVPSIHVVRSHENKGYQELHKRLRNIRSLRALYLCKSSDADTSEICYPAVFKEVAGFGSSGVSLVHSKSELERAGAGEVRLSLREAMKAIRTRLGYFVRKNLLRRKNLRPFGDYYRPLKRCVVQRYVRDLGHDFKVIAFQKRIFALERTTPPGDFRASGSGLFRFEYPPEGLLDFARRLLWQFDEPYMSLDICFDGSNYHLIEFQGAHFGPYTVMNAPSHFVWEDGRWSVSAERLELEEVIAESIIDFLDRTLGRKLQSAPRDDPFEVAQT